LPIKESSQTVLILAPLRGVTDAIFRDTLALHFRGFDRAVAPFISSVCGRRVKTSHLRDILPKNNRRLPLVPQVLSKEADEFITMADAIARLGYDTVNWNLGCPYPMVARKGRGSGLLPHPERIDAFLERVMSAISIHLSVKIRLGRFDSTEIVDLLPVFNRYPLAEVTIHPRTGVQMYTGKVDLERFARCLSGLQHPVVFNGDITGVGRQRSLAKRFPGVKGWMIGRGAVRNPFIAESIRSGGQPILDRMARFRRFHDDLYRRYADRLHGPAHLLDRMKGLWGYFGGAFDEGRTLVKAIRKCRKTAQYEQLVSAFFDGPDLRREETEP
jgi:tRNA-dihydrouridine synthase B